jgi:predicted kinase
MIKILVMAGLPGSGKSTLAKKLQEETKKHSWRWNADNNLYDMDRYHKYNEMDRFYSNFRYSFKSNQKQIIDGLYMNNDDYAQLIKSLYEHNCMGDTLHQFEFHYFIPDREQCLINDKYRKRDKDSSVTIKNAKVEEPNIEYLAQFTNVKIKVETHKVYRKSDFELFAEKHNVADGLWGDSWSRGGTWCNYDDKCGTITPDEEPKLVPESYPEFDKFLDKIFPGMSDEMKQYFFDKTVTIHEYDDSDYYGGTDHRSRFVCDLKHLYELLEEKELIVMGALLG